MNKQEFMANIANLESKIEKLKTAVNEQPKGITKDLIGKIADQLARMIDENGTRYVTSTEFGIKNGNEIDLEDISLDTSEMEYDIEDKITNILKLAGVHIEEEVEEEF